MAESLSIFVTAGTSPLGRSVVRQLVARGHKVTAVTQGKAGADMARKDGALPVYADPTRAGELRSMMKMSKPSVVINLLPQVPNTLLHDGNDWKGFDTVLRASTDALLEASQASGVAFLVHTSYTLLYGETHAPADENTARTAPGDHPAFSAAIEAEGKVQRSAVPSCILRAGYLYGGADHNLSLYAGTFRRNQPFYAGGGHKTAWVHHEDMARACVLAAEQQPKGEVFNIADDKPVSLGDFIETYATMIGAAKTPRLPLLAGRLLPHIADEQITLLEFGTEVSTSKAQSKLGWKPQYPSYQQGLEQALLILRATETAR
jgi:nucleoside-diphosphate-sugar epimerase